MNYSEMPAGPEMDRLIAVEVMGRTLPIEYGILYKDGRESWGQSASYTMEKFDNYHRQGIAERLLQRPDLGGWSPSESIAHAWEVVEKLIACIDRPTFVQLVAGAGSRCVVGWSDGQVDAEASTMMLAICRAALTALKPET